MTQSGSEGTDFFSRSFSRNLICLPSSKLCHCSASWNWWARSLCPSYLYWPLTTWVAGFIPHSGFIVPSRIVTKKTKKISCVSYF